MLQIKYWGTCAWKTGLIRNENLSKLQSAIISSIQKVYKMNEMVENHDHTIGQIEIEIGLPPGIKVHLNSKESRAFAS